MIEKQIQKVEVNQIIESQIPSYLITDENDGFIQLLKQYYISQEFQGASVNIVENIPEYKNPDIFNTEDLVSSTTLTSSIEDFSDEISVTSTLGWPSRYGLLKIDDEIITYTSKTDTKFLGCIRGFSGIERYNRKDQVSSLVFSTTSAASHTSGVIVNNLSNLFLKEFLFKSKSQFTPGFEDYELANGLDQTLFLKKVNDFYKSKGTDDAFKLLFKILYGKNVQVIKPQDYLIKPSDGEYLTNQALLVDFIEGENLTELETLSIFQDSNAELGIIDSSASISSVETLEIGNKRLYRLVLDSATIEGEFKISGRTKTLEQVSQNASVINVDSTIGFPSSGSFDYFDSFGDKITISYTSKTVNQFLGCSGVIFTIPENTTLNFANYAFIDNPFSGTRTTVKLLKVINNIENYDTTYFSPNDYVTIRSFGEYYNNDPKLNSWIFNVRTTFEVTSIEKQSSMYKFTLLDPHQFLVGNKFELYSSVTNSIVNTFTITQIINDRVFLGNFGDFTLDISKKYYIKRIIEKVNSEIYPELNSCIGNVSNVYVNDEHVYVASNSLPAYTKNNTKISASKNSVVFTINSNNILTSISQHNFYSGERVYVQFSSSTSLNNNYFVKVIDSVTLKLCKSAADVFSQKFVVLTPGQTATLTLSSLYSKSLSVQPILRKIKKDPLVSFNKTETTTNNGIGVLINGVELLSYKSTDYIAYGPVSSVKILNGGKDYDIINPPQIIVEDNFSGIGTGAELVPYLSGGLHRIDILNPGFDLLDVPEISISGGNGSGAKAFAKIKSVEYSIECKSSIGINTINDFISFESPHKFKNGEDVFYLNLGTQAIGVGSTSLINGAVYYVNVLSPTTIKLSNSKFGALTNTDFINFSSFGNGIHKFQSVKNKNVLSSIVVDNPGSGYKNYPRIITSSGINTFTSTFTFDDHQFSDGDKVVYSTTGTPISGLSTSTTYYAIKVDKNSFRLATSENNSTNKIYVQISSLGSGYHTFNYDPITVTISAKNGFGTSTYNPIIRPVFAGSVDRIIIKNGGSNYGNDEIVNFEANPLVKVEEPVPAELKPVIVNGRIKEVIIDNAGSGYQSAPNLFVGGNGNGAKLVAILNLSGGISSVYVESEGNGYDKNTTSIIPQPFGDSLVVEAKVKKWTFDRNKKLQATFKDDDGVILASKNNDEKLQFYSTYAPKELRKTVFTSNFDGTKNYNITDFDNETSLSKSHSPILGWAYDGCPIYGQYAFSKESGGEIKKLKSGYTIKTNRNDGPSSVKYALGTFIEDYQFSSSGDLDEHNGRYCVTPEYPNGVYAYFSTNLEFPYIIGNTFNYFPDIENLVPYISNLNQNINYESLKLKRFTFPYKISNNFSKYDYFASPKDSLKFPIKIDKVSSGKINSFNIISAGKNYSVGDFVVNNINNQNIGKITEVLSDDILSLETSSSEFNNCPLIYNKSNSSVEIFTTSPHQFNNLDSVFISGVSTSSLERIRGYSNVGFTSFTYNLSVSIGNTGFTGIVTNISLNSVDNIKSNSIIKISNEKLLVLNVYPNYNTLRVQREYTTAGLGQSYVAGENVSLIPTSFKVITGFFTDLSTKVNEQTYFDPKYSVGIASVGISTTITIFTGIGYTTKSINSKSIYIPNHGFKTGQKLLYSSGGGSSVGVSTDGITTFSLPSDSFVYVAKYNNDEIGISTTPVGIGSTGFIGIGTNLNILFFSSIGSGEKHSFKTTFSEITCDVKKVISTLTTSENYTIKGAIDLIVLPNKVTNIKLVYDDNTRRILINPKNSTSVDVLTNSLTIDNHEYQTGDKVFYKTTGSAIGGLTNNSYYYVIRETESKIKLVEYYSNIFNPDNNIVNISGSGTGIHTFYLVNPKLNLYKGNTIIFDTSDSSLSEVISGVRTSVFSFDIYTDPNFNERYSGINSSILKTGTVGIGSTFLESNLTLKTDENTPDILYYALKPIKTSESSQSKNTIVRDEDVNESFKLSFASSLYNDKYLVSGITSTTFSINLSKIPESLIYNNQTASIKYKTTENGSIGKINSILVLSSDTYEYPLTNLSINSKTGTGGIVSVNSNEIGKISDISSLVFTSEIPSDPTLVPIVDFPQILRVDESSSIKFIGVNYAGKKYTYPPKLLVFDNKTNTIVPDVELNPILTGTSISRVDIISNTKSLYDVSPTILSVNNSNGVGITTISYNNTTKTVLVSLASSFSVASDYPFEIGKKVFVENIGIRSTGTGFNSSDYNYKTFEVVGVNTSLGGAKATVSYKLPSYASNPSIGIATFLGARIIPEEDIPTFNVLTEINSFNPGENILSNEKIGKLVSWNPKSKLLKIISSEQFNNQDILFGSSSRSRARVIENKSYTSDFSIGALTKPFKFFNKETGKVSETFQRFEDSDYNQLFSYSLKSEISYENWKTPVLALSHPSGYKAFSDLQVISTGTTSVSNINFNEVKSTVDIFNESSTYCRQDYDIVSENNLQINNKTYSNQIYFDSKIISNFINSKTNRSVILDDISSQFNSNPRSEKYSLVSQFEYPKHRYIKNFIFVKDALRTNDKAFYQFSVLNDDPNFETSLYGSNWTSYDLGYFDMQKTNDSILQIQFYPYNFEYNNFNITNLSISLLDTSTSGITTQSIGSIGAIEVSPRVSIAASISPVANQILGFSTTKYSSSKILAITQSSLGLIQSNEITITHNGNEVVFSDYGEIISDEISYGGAGLGTFGASISGGNVILNFTPYAGIGVTVFCHITGITSNTGVGTTFIGASYIDSSYLNILNSVDELILNESSKDYLINNLTTSNPIDISLSDAVCEYDISSYSCAYILAEVKDITNNSCYFSELVLINDDSESYLHEYNITYNNAVLGYFSSEISNGKNKLLFTPSSNNNLEVKTIKYVTNETNNVGLTTYTNAEMEFQYGRYVGRNIDVKNSFQLTHNGYPVFYKTFDGSNSGIVSITDNVINIPSHLFSNGEKIFYDYIGSPIGIQTTNIIGVGITNKLPSEVYVIKVDENKIKLASSPQNVLSIPTVPLVLTSVGIGTNHSFNPEKQNTKLLITLDNIIQSPLVPSNISYITTDNFSDLTSLLKLTGINNISSGDILKINNEYLKVVNVGIATTNGVVVSRGIFNTTIASHPVGSAVTKYNGSYEVIKNTLYFVDSPYGKVGIDSNYYSSFNGRVFLRTGQPGSAITAYSENFVFDDVSISFTGVGKTFTLTNNTNNIIGISTNNGIVLINNVPQVAGASQNYYLQESGGTSTQIIFNGSNSTQSYDVNTTGVPRSGVINEYTINTGFGLQPLIGAGGTAIVSIAGTISSVSIGNTGSGYRSGIQTSVYVKAIDPITGISTNIGFGNISSGFVTSVTITNPGFGYTSSNPPLIEIDEPLIYQDLPLLGGSGNGAKISIVVGHGSSIIDFNITNYGYGYNDGDTLYLETGGSVGIQTLSNVGSAFTPVTLRIDSIYNDKFAGWTFGELQTLDDLTPQVDGLRTTFILTSNNDPVDLRSNNNSLINLAANLIILRNGIVQIPNDSYSFSSGSILTFTEAPSVGDKIQVMFYKGSLFDSEFVDVESTIKPGDKITLSNTTHTQDERLVKQIVTSNTIETNYYDGIGIATNTSYKKILTWYKQKEDLIIDGNQVSKSREISNSKLIPVSNIISPISIGSTEIFVQSANPLFKEFDDIPESNLNVVVLDANAGIGTTGFANYEKLDTAKISGDFGIISGIYTGTVGSGLTALIFDFVIPSNSVLRNISVVGSSTTISGISSNYYFVLSETNVGNGVTSISNSGSVVGVGTSFIDNVYQVYSTLPVTINAFGIGTTLALRVTTLVNSYAGITTGETKFFGNYSWGRIYDFNGTTSKAFTLNNQNGLTGISTSPAVLRIKQIRTPY